MANLWRGGKARVRDKGKEGEKVTGVLVGGGSRGIGGERGWEREAGRRPHNSLVKPGLLDWLLGVVGDLDEIFIN